MSVTSEGRQGAATQVVGGGGAMTQLNLTRAPRESPLPPRLSRHVCRRCHFLLHFLIQTLVKRLALHKLHRLG